jgi:nucleoside-diphosphate-sugar epimerase
MNILFTGFSGNLGPEIARQLAPHRILALIRAGRNVPRTDGVEFVSGTLEDLPTALAPEVEVIVHSAAATAFGLPLEDLRRVNVDGTSRLLEFARGCPRLRRFIHLSTTCVCGNLRGFIPEAPLEEAPGFLNAYEQSKWEAEQVTRILYLPYNWSLNDVGPSS